MSQDVWFVTFAACADPYVVGAKADLNLALERWQKRPLSRNIPALVRQPLPTSHILKMEGSQQRTFDLPCEIVVAAIAYDARWENMVCIA